MTDPQGEQPVPVASGDNDALVRVMHDHGVTQEQLAAMTGYSAGHISRVCNGEYGVPPGMIRAVWQLTRDQRLVEICFGDVDRHLIPIDRTDARPDAEIFSEAIKELGSTMSLLGEHIRGAGNLPKVGGADSINRTCALLVAASRRMSKRTCEALKRQLDHAAQRPAGATPRPARPTRHATTDPSAVAAKPLNTVA